MFKSNKMLFIPSIISFICWGYSFTKIENGADELLGMSLCVLAITFGIIGFGNLCSKHLTPQTERVIKRMEAARKKMADK